MNANNERAVMELIAAATEADALGMTTCRLNRALSTLRREEAPAREGELREDFAALAGFVDFILDDGEQGAVEPEDIESAAVSAGLYVQQRRMVPCGDSCACVEYVDEGEQTVCNTRTPRYRRMALATLPQPATPPDACPEWCSGQPEECRNPVRPPDAGEDSKIRRVADPIAKLTRNLRQRADSGETAHGRAWCDGVRFAVNQIEAAQLSATPSDAVGVLVDKWRGESKVAEFYSGAKTLERCASELAAALAARAGVEVTELIEKWREPHADDECTLYTMGRRSARNACADELSALLGVQR